MNNNEMQDQLEASLYYKEIDYYAELYFNDCFISEVSQTNSIKYKEQIKQLQDHISFYTEMISCPWFNQEERNITKENIKQYFNEIF